MKNIIRGFIAIWFLLGWILHIYLALFQPQIYEPFGSTALLPGFNRVWDEVFIPNIRILAVLLAIFEVCVGIALIYKGRWVKIGLILSILFNLFLVQLGLSFTVENLWQDFLANRLPNVFFIAIQVPLLWLSFDRSIVEVIRSRT